MTKTTKKRGLINSKRKRVFLFLLIILILLSIYILFIETNRLELTYIGKGEEAGEYSSNNELRIAFFADLHLYQYRPFHDRLLNRIKDYHPDVILFGGDALAKWTDVKGLVKFFDRLKGIAPTYTIFGNWEEYAPVHMRQRFESLDIPLIEKESTAINIKGYKLGITGLESHYFFRNTERLSQDGKRDYDILLIHSPLRIDEYPDILDEYDLVLAGHTHGGQFYIPFITKDLMSWKNGNEIKFLAGEYHHKDTMIYVTRGVGQWFPGRLNCPPELVILDLNRSGDF